MAQNAACLVRRFSFETCVSAASSAHGRKGTVTDVLDPDRLNGGNVDLYVCGPPAMVEATRAWLDERGVTPVNFYTEKFSPSRGATAPLGQIA